MRHFCLNFFMTENKETLMWLMGPNGNYKDICYFLFVYIYFVGSGLGQSRAVSKKYVVLCKFLSEIA